MRKVMCKTFKSVSLKGAKTRRKLRRGLRKRKKRKKQMKQRE